MTVFQRVSFPWTLLKPLSRISSFRSAGQARLGFSSRTLQPCSPVNKRVIGIVAHIDAGKTTTTERMLYYAGSVRRMGNVDAGSTVMDFMPEERERGITISSAAISFPWRSHQLNLIDTPGHLDFYIEVERSLRVMDGVVAIIDGVAGVQTQTETVWRQADAHDLPRIIFVNKLDRDGPGLAQVLASVRERLKANPVLLYMPFPSKGLPGISSFIDLVSLELISYSSSDVQGTDPVRRALTATEMSPEIVAARDAIVEAAADYSEPLMTAFVEGTDISVEVLRQAVRSATISRSAVPVACGSALKNRGIQALLDSVVDYLPSPLERSCVLGEDRQGNPVELKLLEDGDMVALAFKVVNDSHRGRLVYFRVFSGSLRRRSVLNNATKRRKEQPSKLLRIFADHVVETEHAGAGDIVAAAGLKYTETGDTLTSFEADPIRLAGVSAPPSVFSAAIEANSESEERKLENSLASLLAEDPSLSVSQDPLTGQMLLCGMGELHLETAHTRLRDHYKVKCSLSRPRVSYRETVKKGTEHVCKYNRTIGNQKLLAELRIKCTPNGRQKNNVRVAENIVPDTDETSSTRDEVIESVDVAVRNALDRGVLIGMPVIGVDVDVLSPGETQNKIGRSSTAAYAACASEGLTECLESVETVLCEPVMKVRVEVGDTYVGEVTSDLSDGSRRRGIVERVERTRDGKHARIYARVPLEGMIGWATKLRSLTKGTGNFVMEYDKYEQMNSTIQTRALEEIRGF